MLRASSPLIKISSLPQLCNVVFKNNFAIADISNKRYFKNTKCSTEEQKKSI
jgi:hypothetical protein